MFDLERQLNEAAAGTVPGAAAVLVSGGEFVSRAAVGVADAATGRPLDLDCLFEAASLSKPAFALAALQLVSEGALALDRPLSELFDVDSPDETARGVTARPPFAWLRAHDA
jgi:CubicO group peptidase (beta-lactamase class C family)